MYLSITLVMNIPETLNNNIKKTIKISFCHPVEGKVRFRHPNNGRIVKSMKIYSNEDCEVEIPLKGITAGLWDFVFEWEYADKFFCINRNVVI